MQADWISVERIAQAHGISVPAALELAERMNWPRIFRARDTLVLAPSPLART